MVARSLTSPIIEDISHIVADWDASSLLERRFAYDANDNVEYQGVALPGTATTGLRWIIFKYTWEAGSVSGFNNTRVQVASDEIKFDKAWDSRNTYF